jgi:hypothetical protein
MFCPEGFHLIHEIEAMAHNIVDAKLPWLPPEIAVKFAEKENYSKLDAYEDKWNNSQQYLLFRLVDNFLDAVKDIWICPARGNPLKFSKAVLLPTTSGFLSRSDTGNLRGNDYFTFRETEYASVDTTYWVIDKNKDSRRTVDLSEFHGWSLCIKAEDFPKSEAKLLKVTGLFPSASDASSKGRPPAELNEALNLLSIHFPNGTSALTVKEVWGKVNGYNLFSEKTLARAMRKYNDQMLTK